MCGLGQLSTCLVQRRIILKQYSILYLCICIGFESYLEKEPNNEKKKKKKALIDNEFN